ncbi:vWA domain-containing protein [Sulfurimonas autotrophica]|uniref:TPR repeat-containing protein n=1 Tax=Sulfurimonas autotrophica (strain ATCC BAA-671 / DSM 16294 / JCM 11897 / OK10) TaxID=563040 RepID=E0UPD3_SULAO|nr:VWA domain-containing protein [Sulfurimonas autotrophica]ADN09663.1 TPR repeat-containing protein [Sulfurimonas autotrophica DSM 16294]
MTLLYPWVLFVLIPLYFLYKRDTQPKEKKRQKNLLYIALFFTLLTLSRPVIINAPSEQKFDAKDYIIALDASFSMQADDLKPTRYEVAKKNIAHIIKSLSKDRFSIFAFTSNAMLISPPTTDSAISMMALNSLEPKYILTKGTSLLSLFKTIAKTSYKEKNLIIFTDGGEDRDLSKLVKLCKKNSIIPYIVATGSNSGTTLKQDDKPILDNNKNLVISKINPLLEPLAKECGGKYYELNTNKDIADEIIADIKKQNSTIKSTTKVLSYKELFMFPLFIALLSFFISVTKLHQFFVFLPLLFLPYPGHTASFLDFYHNNKANQAYKSKKFITAAKEFQKLSPSPKSYYNNAVAYYKAKNYKKSIKLFSQIKSTNPKLKQNIFYNLGNCAVSLKKYNRAKHYYQKALALGFDKDAFYNLSLLYKLGLKEQKNLSDMLPKKSTQKKQTAKEQQNEKKDASKSGSSKSNQKASQKSSGSGKNSKKKKQENQNLQLVKHKNKSKYKLGYKAYELINKGYTNEKHPW